MSEKYTVMAKHQGPLPFSATDFDEEDKALLRQWAYRRAGGDKCFDVFNRDVMRMTRRYGGDLMKLLDLILRELGK